jgi:serine/threonine-protein kinase 24/25/MST4
MSVAPSGVEQICLQYDYHLITKLGEGTYGTVYQAEHKPTGETVAIKHMKMVMESKLHLRAVAREIDLLYKMSKMENNKYST